MTILTTQNRRTYSGDGTSMAFSYPERFLAAEDLRVFVRVDDTETEQTLTTHYTVAGAGLAAGGTVTFLTAPVSGSSIVIVNDPAIKQSVDYEEGGSFPAETHETGLDRLTIIAQRLSDRFDRTLQFEETEDNPLTAQEVLDRVSDAETARNEAQAAKAGAETAQSGAQTAQTAAEAAAALAQAANPPFPISQVTGLQTALDGKAATSHTHNASDINAGTLNAARLDMAVAADIRAKAANHLLDVPGIYAAHAPVTLTDAATIAVDLNTGTVFTVTLGGNRTLGNPTNATVGQSGLIRVVQDGTGSRTLALASEWLTAGGDAPELSTGAADVDLFSYLVYASGTVYLFPIGKDFS